MLLFGHRFINSESFYHISDIDAISKTPSNSTIYLEFSEENLDIIKHLNENGVTFTLSVNAITQLVYASALNATYIVVPQELASSAQRIAESYLFDAKILVSVEDEETIAEMAELSIDGVIFSNAVIKINS